MISYVKTRKLALLTLMVLLPACQYYQGPPSDHFDGTRFFNGEPGPGFLDHLKWLWEMEPMAWPEWVADPPQPRPVERVSRGELRVTYVNQATVLIQMDSVNILTDPFWSERAGPFSWMGARRVRAPGIRMEELPPIDLVLISHDHYDHLDLPTLKSLCAQHQPIVLAGLGVKARLEQDQQRRTVELDWWDEYALAPDLRITFVPARHASGRGLFDNDRILWGGYVIEGPGGRVLFFGDTAAGGFLGELHNRFDRFRLAILPLGSYEKRWFMKSQHMNPDDAVQVHRMLNVSRSVGIHFGTLDEHPEQAIDAHEKDLAAALAARQVPASDFLLLGFGEGREF